MSSATATASAAPVLSAEDLRRAVRDAVRVVPARARVLAVIPDRTRDDNTDLLFPLLSQELAARGAGQFDALIAQGTHPAMSDVEKRVKIGAGLAEMPLVGTIFDHHWDRPSELVTLGTITRGEVFALSGGLMDQDVPVQLNARLAPGMYDYIFVVGATVPHEVAGFAGGSKYFFPGVAGPELTHLTHFTSVSTRRDSGLLTHALFTGGLRETVRQAAAVSSQIHVRYTGRRYRRVIALLDEHYDEMWVGGKASYKLGAVIEDGGELIIYAPHLKGISTTHGRLIEKYGYAPLETVREMVEGSDELQANLCVAAHLAHVSYGSRIGADGKIAPRYRITLASGISEEICTRVKLGYQSIASVDLEGAGRDPDTLVVEHAGQDLYLVESDR